MIKLYEGLDYHDMKGQVKPKITVDEYAAKMGADSDIVTVTFIVKSKQAGEDLTSWLELGYGFILDAAVSDGELEPNKWLVFVEMLRDKSAPRKIINMMEDLKTLTDIDLDDWSITINDRTFKADEAKLKQEMILSPEEYELRNPEEEPKIDEPEIEEPEQGMQPQEPVLPAPEVPQAVPAPVPAAQPAAQQPAAPTTPPAVAEQKDLNKMRQLAGLDVKKVYNIDDEIRKYITNAGL